MYISVSYILVVYIYKYIIRITYQMYSCCPYIMGKSDETNKYEEEWCLSV